MVVWKCQNGETYSSNTHWRWLRTFTERKCHDITTFFGYILLLTLFDSCSSWPLITISFLTRRKATRGIFHSSKNSKRFEKGKTGTEISWKKVDKNPEIVEFPKSRANESTQILEISIGKSNGTEIWREKIELFSYLGCLSSRFGNYVNSMQLPIQITATSHAKMTGQHFTLESCYLSVAKY